MSYTPPTTSPGNVWTYSRRSLSITKGSASDTNTYAVTNTTWELKSTLYINVGVPNAKFLVRMLYTRYTLDASAAASTTIYAKIVIGGLTYSSHSVGSPGKETFEDTYIYPDIVTTDDNGNIVVEIYAYEDNPAYTTYLSDIEIRIVGEIVL